MNKWSRDFEKDKEDLEIKKYSEVLKLTNMSFKDLIAVNNLLVEREIEHETIMMNIKEEGDDE